MAAAVSITFNMSAAPDGNSSFWVFFFAPTWKLLYFVLSIKPVSVYAFILGCESLHLHGFVSYLWTKPSSDPYEQKRTFTSALAKAPLCCLPVFVLSLFTFISWPQCWVTAPGTDENIKPEEIRAHRRLTSASLNVMQQFYFTPWADPEQRAETQGSIFVSGFVLFCFFHLSLNEALIARCIQRGSVTHLSLSPSHDDAGLLRAGKRFRCASLQSALSHHILLC